MLNAIDSCSDDGMFYTNFETTMGKTLLIDDEEIQELRISIYELMNGSDDNNSLMCQKLNNSKNSSSSKMDTSSSISSSSSKNSNGIHTSPRTVATSCDC
jgi:hypothetical protein